MKDFNNSRVGKALKVMQLNDLEKSIRVENVTNPTEEDLASRSALDTDRVMQAGKTLLSEQHKEREELLKQKR